MNSLDKTIFKGIIHLGIILEKELKKLPKRRLTILISEFPQLLGYITKGKRRINSFQTEIQKWCKISSSPQFRL